MKFPFRRIPSIEVYFPDNTCGKETGISGLDHVKPDMGKTKNI